MMLRLLIPALCFAFLLGGCNHKTTISREDQLKNDPTSTTADVTAATSETTEATAASEDTTGVTEDTTGATEDTTVADQTDAAEETNTSEPEETKAEETKPEVTRPQENKPQNNKPQETKPQETKPVVTEPEKTEPVETKPEDTKPEDTKPEETKPEETKPEETEPEVTEPDTSNELRDISGYSMGQLEYEIVDAMNAQRTAAGLPTFTINHYLSAICSVRAYECSLSWSHTRPDGTECFTALTDYGYSGYSMAAENLLSCTKGYTAAEMVDGWMNSDGHRANIMDPNFTETGVDVYEYNGMLYVAAFYTN